MFVSYYPKEIRIQTVSLWARPPLVQGERRCCYLGAGTGGVFAFEHVGRCAPRTALSQQKPHLWEMELRLETQIILKHDYV